MVNTYETEWSEMKQEKSNLRSFDILTTGDLEGELFPYTYEKKDGYVQFQYKAHSIIGIGLFDVSNLVIKLPNEFKYVAVQEELKEAITGDISYPVILGNKKHVYTSDDMTLYADRIVLKNPAASYILGAKFKANILIEYGKILELYPEIPIADNPDGYKFQAVLSDNAMIDFSLLGSTEGTWTSEGTQAIIKQ